MEMTLVQLKQLQYLMEHPGPLKHPRLRSQRLARMGFVFVQPGVVLGRFHVLANQRECNLYIYTGCFLMYISMYIYIYVFENVRM
jgi:hypothetical protein